MEEYSVMLVDDEEDVIQIIMKKIDFQKLGFHVVGYAQNGVEALEMAESLEIDVVMTDIKMPYMDGLTMAKRLKEDYPNTKVIICSGFDEFEYAKEAIEIEAEKYILKPIDTKELTEVFERIKQDLDKERHEKQDIEKLKQYYEESLPLLQENFYGALLAGSIPKGQMEHLRRTYQISVEGNYFVVSILHISNGNRENEVGLDPMLEMLSVKQFAQERLDKLPYQSKIVTYLKDLIVITAVERLEDITSFTDAMDKLCKMALRICAARVTAGIGYACKEIEQLNFSYEGARNAVSYRTLYGTVRAINIHEIEPRQKEQMRWERDYTQKIFRSIKFRRKEELRTDIQEFVTRIRQEDMSLKRYHIVLMEMVTELSRFISDNNIVTGDNVKSGLEAYQAVMQLDSLDELENWMVLQFTKMMDLIQEEKTEQTQSFVERAKEYVVRQYHDQELTVEAVCKQLGVSTAYFSTVFKKETGKTFINYLTDYRMEQALRLLVEEDEKAYIIANKVGYADPNYFSYVFKRKYGMSPSKYKAGIK